MLLGGLVLATRSRLLSIPVPARPHLRAGASRTQMLETRAARARCSPVPSSWHSSSSRATHLALRPRRLLPRRPGCDSRRPARRAGGAAAGPAGPRLRRGEGRRARQPARWARASPAPDRASSPGAPPEAARGDLRGDGAGRSDGRRSAATWWCRRSSRPRRTGGIVRFLSTRGGHAAGVALRRRSSAAPLPTAACTCPRRFPPAPWRRSVRAGAWSRRPRPCCGPSSRATRCCGAAGAVPGSVRRPGAGGAAG